MLQAQTALAVPVRHSSGRYQYKNWAHSAAGDRIAVFAKGRSGDAPSDLINTAYRNQDGSRIVFGIAFDFDAERAAAKWKDDRGALSWNKIRGELFKTHSEILPYLTHVTKSTSGKGFGVVLSIAPLPIQPTTQANQTAALSLQSRLISLFASLGFGADPSARGIERDTPNFNDPSRVVHRDEVTKRRIEKNSELVVSKLHGYLNEYEKKHRNENRLYPDARVEVGLARLFLWLLGAEKARVSSLRTPLFLSCDSVTATTQQLGIVTGLGEKFLRNFLSHPPEWLKTAYFRGEGWELSLNITNQFSALWARSNALAKNPHADFRSASVVVRDLKLPWAVEDGERNRWLTSLALLYKWHGFSEDAAKQKIILRMHELPEFERSRNCKQLRSILKSIYSRMPETFGMHSFRELPEWVREDKFFCSLIGRLNPRRGVTPGAPGPQKLCESFFLLSPPEFQNLSPFSEDKTLSECKVIALPIAFKHTEENRHKTVVVVRHAQRVGIFDDGKLILCLTKRHYKASSVIEWLERRPEFSGTTISVFSPKRALQLRYFKDVEEAEVIQASQICGKKKTAREKFLEWFEKKGIPFQPSETIISQLVELDIPF